MVFKRLGIFLFCNEDGEVDKYVDYLLSDIQNNLTELVIVCNGMLNVNGKSIFNKYTNKIYIRPNVGFDIGGFRDAINEYIGIEYIRKFDELVLFNDSFFGPLYPFQKIFGAIEDKYDFWGLSVHGETKNIFGMCPYGYRPRYLQTYFLAIRKKMLLSFDFEQFWLDLPLYSEFNEVGEKFSCVFTKYFEDRGFKWKALSDTSDLETVKEKAMSYHTFNTYDMVARRKFPIVKRKTFITSKDRCLRYNYGGEIPRVIQYLKENSEYDVNLIYRYLLKNYNLYDLKNSFNWTKIISEQSVLIDVESEQRVLVIAHLFYEECFEYCLSYLVNVPIEYDIVITTDSDDKRNRLLEKIEKKRIRAEVRLVKSRGRDLAALLVGCKDLLKKYDYFCFVHDKKSTQKEFATVGSSFCDLLWNSVLFSENYIRNIISYFEMEECLGLLVPPNVYHGTYYHSAVDYWTICYDKTIELADRMNLKAKIEKEKPPISVGTVFWCRSNALIPLFELELDYSDFPGEPLPNDGSLSHALERILPYVAQSEGYYTSTIMPIQLAETEIENMRFMWSDILHHISGIPGINCATHQHLINSIDLLKEDLETYKNKALAIEIRDYEKKLAQGRDKCEQMENELKFLREQVNKKPEKEIVYIEIGVKKALKNYFTKKIGNLRNCFKFNKNKK